jgi:alpha-L-rhamnosidase
MLPGLRSVIAEFDALVHDDGLLHQVPGWPFMDWVGGVIEERSGIDREGWKYGCAPGVEEHDSSIVNLQWVMALQAAAQVEEAYGEPLYAQRHNQVARETMDRIVARYWDAKRGLILNTTGNASASEHAQLFALLTGLLDAEKTKACLAALRKGDGLDKATIYFSYYALEANYRYAEAGEFYRRLDFWRSLIDQGFKTTPEAPEPTRSDSHPWGAHPAYHTLASIAGVRPAAPGFAKVRIAPLLNNHEHFEAKVVHPKGMIEVAYRQGSPKSSFTISLPQGIPGELVFNGQTHALKPGKNELSV